MKPLVPPVLALSAVSMQPITSLSFLPHALAVSYCIAISMCRPRFPISNPTAPCSAAEVGAVDVGTALWTVLVIFSHDRTPVHLRLGRQLRSVLGTHDATAPCRGLGAARRWQTRTWRPRGQK